MVAISVWVLTPPPKLTGELTSLSLFPVSLAGQTRESGPRETSSLPSFFSSLSLSFSSSFSPSTRGITYRNVVSESTMKATSSYTSLPDVKTCTSLRVYRAWCQLQQRQRQWQRPIQEEVHGIGVQRKNDRDGCTLNTGNSSRVQSCRRSIPGKTWMPTNQIRAISARSHASRELLARALQASRSI